VFEGHGGKGLLKRGLTKHPVSSPGDCHRTVGDVGNALAFLGSGTFSVLCEAVFLGGGMQRFSVVVVMVVGAMGVIRRVDFVDVQSIAVFTVFLEHEL
jgi:hypothetical protein